MEAKTYFDKKSASYEISRSKILFHFLTGKEKRIAMQFLHPESGDTILEIGAGSGFYTQDLQRQGCDIIATDVSEKMIHQLQQQGIEAFCVDLRSMNFKHAFDKILAAGVLEFIPRHEEYFFVLAKHLKKNGDLVLVYPRTNVGGRLYSFYHNLLHGLSLHILPLHKLNKMFLRAGLEMKQTIPASFTSYVIHLKKK